MTLINTGQFIITTHSQAYHLLSLTHALASEPLIVPITYRTHTNFRGMYISLFSWITCGP